MARQGVTEQLRLWYVPTISNEGAPTTSEIGAGTDLTPFLVRDGLKTPLGGNTIPTASVASQYNTTAPGPFGGQPVQVNLYRDDTDDDAWDALPRGTTGFFVVGRFVGTGNVAASDVVEVWPIAVISREPMDIADNEAQKFTATCSVPTEPTFDAVVA